MIKTITNEIEGCISNNFLISALTLALTLIDACAKIEYPSETKNNIRYKKWYNKFIFDELESNDIDNPHFDFRFPDASEIYDLRCNMLHESNPKSFSKGFTLFFSDGTLNITRNSSGSIIDGETNWKHDDAINGRFIAEVISKYAKLYYGNNVAKFDNQDFSIFTNELKEDQMLYDENLDRLKQFGKEKQKVR